MVRDVAEDRAALRGESLNAWLQQQRMQALRGQAVLDATAVAGTARKLLTGVKALFVCIAEVDRLAQAVEELERLAGPGGDLDLFVKVLQLDAVPPAAMDLDTEEEAISSSRANSSPAMFPTPGIKRKRAGSSSVVDVDRDGDSALRRTPDSKRRVPAWWQFPSFSALSAASRRSPVPHHAARTRTFARSVAMVMVRERGRIGKPARRRPPAGLHGARRLVEDFSAVRL